MMKFPPAGTVLFQLRRDFYIYFTGEQYQEKLWRADDLGI
jgi:hypothetical protein